MKAENDQTSNAGSASALLLRQIRCCGPRAARASCTSQRGRMVLLGQRGWNGAGRANHLVTKRAVELERALRTGQLGKALAAKRRPMWRTVLQRALRLDQPICAAWRCRGARAAEQRGRSGETCFNDARAHLTTSPLASKAPYSSIYGGTCRPEKWRSRFGGLSGVARGNRVGSLGRTAFSAPHG